MTTAPSTLAEIEAAIPFGEVGATPLEIWHEVAMWSRITVVHALRELVRTGRVTFTGPDGKRRYSRVREATRP